MAVGCLPVSTHGVMSDTFLIAVESSGSWLPHRETQQVSSVTDQTQRHLLGQATKTSPGSRPQRSSANLNAGRRNDRRQRHEAGTPTPAQRRRLSEFALAASRHWLRQRWKKGSHCSFRPRDWKVSLIARGQANCVTAFRYKPLFVGAISIKHYLSTSAQSVIQPLRSLAFSKKSID